MSNNLSIKDIARMAGVSIATVSRVINKNGKVAKDTEKKILKVMEENNYVPNLLAKGFRTRKSTVIGIVVPDIANEFFSRIAQKVQMLFFEKGYATIICNTNEDYKLENQCLDMLQAQQVGGIIHIVSSTRKREKAVPMPTVYIDREPMYIKNDDVVVVESDNVSGGYQATKEMLEKGCKNILCLSPEHNVSTHKKRYLGYLKAIEEAGLESHLVYAGSISMEDGYEQTKKYFKENPTIDGVFATTAISTISSTGWRTVEIVLVDIRATSLSSYPNTLTSCGTFIFNSFNAFIAPIAIMSVVANTPSMVGFSLNYFLVCS